MREENGSTREYKHRRMKQLVSNLEMVSIAMSEARDSELTTTAASCIYTERHSIRDQYILQA